MESTWTIAELAEHAVTALAADGSQQVNGRVRDMPNERLIRWYTTIGLVDPPLGRRGRTALYGRRHLLQLVAIKRRQAAGLKIAEIQAELAGAPDSTLRDIARVTEHASGETSEAPSRGRFWAARPADTPDPAVAPPASVQRADAEVVQGVRLAPDLTLLLNVPSLDGDDLAAIRSAARPLLDELRRRGLIDPDRVPPTTEPPGSSA